MLSCGVYAPRPRGTRIGSEVRASPLALAAGGAICSIPAPGDPPPVDDSAVQWLPGLCRRIVEERLDVAGRAAFRDQRRIKRYDHLDRLGELLTVRQELVRVALGCGDVDHRRVERRERRAIQVGDGDRGRV